MPTVEHLLHLWQDEGFNTVKISEEDEPSNIRLKWELWLVTSRMTSYEDYGRHGVIRVLLTKEGRKIIKDQLFNASVRNGENLYQISARDPSLLIGVQI